MKLDVANATSSHVVQPRQGENKRSALPVRSGVKAGLVRGQRELLANELVESSGNEPIC